MNRQDIICNVFAFGQLQAVLGLEVALALFALGGFVAYTRYLLRTGYQANPLLG